VEVIKKPRSPAHLSVKREKILNPIPKVNISTGHEKAQYKVLGKHQEEVEGNMGKQSKFFESFRENTFTSGVIFVPPKEKFEGTTDELVRFCFVHKGKVTVQIGDKSFELATGSHFWIPENNNYTMENMSSTSCKLIFCDSR